MPDKMWQVRTTLSMLTTLSAAFALAIPVSVDPQPSIGNTIAVHDIEVPAIHLAPRRDHALIRARTTIGEILAAEGSPKAQAAEVSTKATTSETSTKAHTSEAPTRAHASEASSNARAMEASTSSHARVPGKPFKTSKGETTCAVNFKSCWVRRTKWPEPSIVHSEEEYQAQLAASPVRDDGCVTNPWSFPHCFRAVRTVKPEDASSTPLTKPTGWHVPPPPAPPAPGVVSVGVGTVCGLANSGCFFQRIKWPSTPKRPKNRTPEQ